MPPDDSIWLYKLEAFLPACEDSREENPEDPIAILQPWTFLLASKNGELLSQRQDLEQELGSANEKHTTEQT